MQNEITPNQTDHSPWRQNACLFLLSQGISLFGSSIVQMAIIWQVALETSSGLWVTLLTLSATIPQTVVSFFGGVWADRHPRKRLIIFADLGIAGVTLFLALVFMAGWGTNMLPLLIGASALRSLGAGIQTPAVSAVIPQLVPEAQRMRYNGINSGILSVVQFAAPAAAGLLLSLGPLHWVLLLDAATAVTGVLLLCRVPVAHVKQEDGPGTGFFTELKAGIAYAAGDKAVRRLLLVFGAFIFLSVPSGFLAVLMVERTFGSHYGLLTIVEMAGFGGMVLGGAALGLWGGFAKRWKPLILGLAGYGLFSLGLGLTRVFWLFAGFMFLACFFIPVVQSTVTTELQETVPPEKQGRVFGLLGAMYSGFMPLGTAIFGPLADVMPIQTMVIGCGGILLLLAGALFLAQKGRRPFPV